MRRPEPGGTQVYVTSCPIVAARARSDASVRRVPSAATKSRIHGSQLARCFMSRVLSTAKWHLKNVFAKLDVSTRTGAIARARLMRLIE